MKHAMQLRPYQRAAIDALYDWFGKNTGNPLIVLPTGAGKSLTMAAFIREACEVYEGTRIVLATHVKELIEQDAKAIMNYWPEAPIGIWSAGLGQKSRAQITVGGIQSMHSMPTLFAGTDLLIIDEAHLMPRRAGTMYRKFLAKLQEHNADLRVIGFTATEYRTDSGLLVDGDDRVFTDVAYSENVGDLIKDGYLCPLISKNGATKADTSNLHVRGGEYIPGELAAAFDHSHLIEGALDEVASYASDRNHVLGFCAGIVHAQHCMEAAQRRGWSAAYVSGEMGNFERDAILADFRRGKYRFLFNAMILTTGYDFAGIDCLLWLRKTKSPGLYMQIMGRGLRNVFAAGYDLTTRDGRLAAIANGPKPNCLVLDFGGNVMQHGPIDQIVVKRKRKKGEDAISVAPMKECPQCQELVYTSVMICPSCQHEWPASASHGTDASAGTIVAALAGPQVIAVDSVMYVRHEKEGRPPSMRVMYQCGLITYNEWVPVEAENKAIKHAVSWFWKRRMMPIKTVDEAIAASVNFPKPETITVVPDGKYWRIVDVNFERMAA